MYLKRQDLIQGKAVRDKPLLKKRLTRPNNSALGQASFLGDCRISPERTAVSIGSQVEKEKESDLLKAQPVENVPQAVVRPCEMLR